MTKRLSAFILVFLVLAAPLMACWHDEDMPKGVSDNYDYMIAQVNGQDASDWNSTLDERKKPGSIGTFESYDVSATPPFKIFVASTGTDHSIGYDGQITGANIEMNSYAVYYMVRRNGTTITDWTRVKLCEYEVSQALANDFNSYYPVSVIGDTLVNPRGLQNGDYVYVVFVYDDISGSMDSIGPTSLEDITSHIENGDDISGLSWNTRPLVVKIIVTGVSSN